MGADYVRVSHRRWEQTQDYDAVNFFKFQWAVTMTFDRRMAQLQSATIAVFDFAFGPVTTADRKKVVVAVLKPWLAPGVLYKRHWLGVGRAQGDASLAASTTTMTPTRETSSPSPSPSPSGGRVVETIPAL